MLHERRGVFNGNNHIFKAGVDDEGDLPKHLFESFVFSDVQMTVRRCSFLNFLALIEAPTAE